MVIGRMHLKDGLVCERQASGGIRLGVTHGGDPFNEHTPVLWFDFTEEAFASMVAHASRRGESGMTFSEALVLLQTEPLVSDQGDGATGETLTNDEAQALVDSGEATPGPEVEEEKTGAPV
jgi:hypothetical protein